MSDEGGNSAEGTDRQMVETCAWPADDLWLWLSTKCRQNGTIGTARRGDEVAKVAKGGVRRIHYDG